MKTAPSQENVIALHLACSVENYALAVNLNPHAAMSSSIPQITQMNIQMTMQEFQMMTELHSWYMEEKKHLNSVLWVTFYVWEYFHNQSSASV